jgi:hypothetical protein
MSYPRAVAQKYGAEEIVFHSLLIEMAIFLGTEHYFFFYALQFPSLCQRETSKHVLRDSVRNIERTKQHRQFLHLFKPVTGTCGKFGLHSGLFFFHFPFFLFCFSSFYLSLPSEIEGNRFS